TATTSVRILSLLVYRRSAYKAFPLLRIRWAYVGGARLREVTSLSAFLWIVDIANKVSYTADTVVITAILGTAPVAIYSVGQRLAMTVGRLTRVLSEKLFPTIVDRAALARRDRLQLLLIQGTRLSLAMVIPKCAIVGLLTQPIVRAWMGPRSSGSIPILQILAIVVAVKVGTMTSQSMLKGTENHRFLAASTMPMSLANLAISIVLARRFGLVGVALGTLISASAVLMLVGFPKACRVVGLSFRDGLPRLVLLVARRAVAPRVAAFMAGDSLRRAACCLPPVDRCHRGACCRRRGLRGGAVCRDVRPVRRAPSGAPVVRPQDFLTPEPQDGTLRLDGVHTFRNLSICALRAPGKCNRRAPTARSQSRWTIAAAGQ